MNYFILAVICFTVQPPVAQALQKCWDKKTFCQDTETCVTWERGCSVGANCLGPGYHDVTTECTKRISHPIFPSRSLCSSDEIFARSVDKLCSKPPCPLRLGYNCYPYTGSPPSCSGIKCPFGLFCVIGESCSETLCRPDALCKFM